MSIYARLCFSFGSLGRTSGKTSRNQQRHPKSTTRVLKSICIFSLFYPVIEKVNFLVARLLVKQLSQT
jgi:hypothetical protein